MKTPSETMLKKQNLSVENNRPIGLWPVENNTRLKAFMGIKSLADGKAKAAAYRKRVL